MTINNPELFCAGLWDWATLDGCFGNTRIKPTDIDGFVERNGKFLIIETKGAGVPIPKGQWITFNELRKLEVFTIIVVWGETNKPEEMQVFTRNGISQKKSCTLDEFRDKVKSWYEFADNKKEGVLQ